MGIKRIAIPKFETVPFDSEDILRVLQDADKPLCWSVIAARILGVKRSEIRLPQVRGVRDACRALQADGRVREPRRLMFIAG